MTTVLRRVVAACTFALMAAPAVAHGQPARDALPRVRSDPFLALNGDTYGAVDLEDLFSFHKLRRADITLALAEVDDVGRFGQIETAEDGRLTKFSEKGRSRGGGLVNAGIYAVNASVIRSLPGTQKLSWERDVLPSHAGRASRRVKPPSRTSGRRRHARRRL